MFSGEFVLNVINFFLRVFIITSAHLVVTDVLKDEHKTKSWK